jgi:hypothetical protein
MFEKVDVTLDGAAFGNAIGADAQTEPAVVWELRAMEVEFWGRQRRLPVPGALPAGYLVLSPRGRFVSTVGGRAADAPGERENEATFRASFASAGEYRIENGRLITRAAHVDEAETVQSRDCNLAGRWLEIATPWLVGSKESTEIRRVVFGFCKMG